MQRLLRRITDKIIDYRSKDMGGFFSRLWLSLNRWVSVVDVYRHKMIPANYFVIIYLKDKKKIVKLEKSIKDRW